MLQIARGVSWCLEENCLLAMDSILLFLKKLMHMIFFYFIFLVLLELAVTLTCGCLVSGNAVRGFGGNHGVHSACVSSVC